MTVRPWHRYALYAGCLLVVFWVVGWISWMALDLDEKEASARRRAALEENVRLALWRMDSAMAPLVARESSRPIEGFMSEQAGDDVKGRFDLNAGLSIPPAVERFQSLAFRKAEQGYASYEAQGDAAFAAEDQQEGALGRLDPSDKTTAAGGVKRAGSIDAQYYKNQNEWNVRARAVQQTVSQSSSNAAVLADGLEIPPAMTPAWHEGELVLLRRLANGRVQGTWLDWEALRARLLREIADLLPNATLSPARRAAAADPSEVAERRLAALPIVLSPGAIPADGERSPLLLILAVAWAALLLAAGAVAWLLAATLSLGERRSAFVSAVTHELRTPLTTLQTYSEMLAEGMVREEPKKQKYLDTLHREAKRLGHLVENVLVYARIEQGRGGDRAVPCELAELIERGRSRIEERAAQAGMTVVIDADPEPDAGAKVLADPLAFEQIVFNLVDNACKYAADAEDKRIHVIARGRTVRIEDHGRGLPSEERRSLFQPFSRSAQRAAGSAPGVGLGLALCRRLARAMGGDLFLDDSTPGASFVLSLRPAP